jgi:hypothetical protein
MMEDLFPLIGQEGILMDVLEDLYFISTSIDIEAILVSDKCMIGSSFGYLISFVVWLSNLIPLFFLNFILEQIVEIGSTFSSIATKEEKAIPIRDGPCA